MDLTVLPDHVYFIQEDTYEGPCHIYEIDRKAGSQVNELVVLQTGDEYFNHLVIFDLVKLTLPSQMIKVFLFAA